MTTARKTILLVLALACILCLSVAFASCGKSIPQEETGGNNLGYTDSDETNSAVDGETLDTATEEGGSVWTLRLNTDGKGYTVTGLADPGTGNVTIPSTHDGLPVTAIDDFACAYNFSLRNVTIPSSVTEIGDYAFLGCAYITSVRIDGGAIGDYAFENCESLIKISMESGVTDIGNYAFYGCPSVTDFCIGENVGRIGKYAFYNCSLITSLEIPSSVTEIGTYAFHDCSSVKTVIMGDGIEEIGGYAFYRCTSISYVYYMGTPEKWSAILMNNGNGRLTDAWRYYYSDTEPDYTGSYNYWHYVDGEITVWVQEKSGGDFVAR